MKARRSRREGERKEEEQVRQGSGGIGDQIEQYRGWREKVRGRDTSRWMSRSSSSKRCRRSRSD